MATSKVTSLFRLDSTRYSVKSVDCVRVTHTAGKVAQIWMQSRPFGQISRKCSGVNCKKDRGETFDAVSTISTKPTREPSQESYIRDPCTQAHRTDK